MGRVGVAGQGVGSVHRTLFFFFFLLFFPPAFSESYCFIIHAMGANRPLAGRLRSQYSQFTGHCAPRARGPPRTTPQSSPPRAEDPRLSSPALSEGGQNGSVEPGGCGERACSLPRRPAPRLLAEAAPGVESNARSSHCSGSGCPGERESLPARGAGGRQQAGLNSRLCSGSGRGGEPVNSSGMKKKKIRGRSLWARCSGDKSRHSAVRVRVPPARQRAARAIFREAGRVSPFSPPPRELGCLSLSLSVFFLTTLRKVISHEAAA